MTQPDLFADYGARLRDLGMAKAASAQDSAQPKWADLAFDAIKRLALRQAEIHVDDVLRVFPLSPARPNAWGSVWQRAIRSGIIARTGRTRPTTDPRKHAHHYPIYSSLITAAGASTTAPLPANEGEPAQRKALDREQRLLTG